MIGVLVLVLLVVFLLWSINQRFLSDTARGFAECPGYCSPSCADRVNDRVVGSRYVLGDNWCRDDAYNLDFDGRGDERLNSHWFRPFRDSAESVSGEQMRLQCCQVHDSQAEIPLSFLPAVARTGEDATTRPRVPPPVVQAYFGASAIPLNNGVTREVVSNKGMEYTIQISQVTGSTDGPDFTLNDEETIVTCSAQFLNVRGEKITISNINPELLCKGDKKIDLEFPSEFVGSIVRLELAFKTKEPQRTVSTFTTTFNIINPIQFSSISNEWAREKAFTVSCRAEICNEFKYYTRQAGAFQGCSPNQAEYVKSADPLGNNQARITIEESGEWRVCTLASTTGERHYTREVPIAVRVDRNSPTARGSFDPVFLRTEISCTKTTAGSRCRESVGYHYIERTVDFLGALVNGASNPNWCPQDERAYRWVAAERDETGVTRATVPYQGNHQFMVMCVMAQDEAGNKGVDIVLNYHTWDIVAQIANRQLSEGGPGSGFYGYNFP